MNRALEPLSKLAIGNWYEQSVLHRLWGFNKSAFTSQKLRVHALYCVLALLLASLARKVALEAGVRLTLPALLKELSAIREVAVIYPPGTLAHPKDHITIFFLTAYLPNGIR